MAYFDKYGVKFSDDRKTLISCPDHFKGSYVIPDGVTSVSDLAFFLCHEITSVEIPDSVIDIRPSAFFGVPNIIYYGYAAGCPWGAKSVNGYVDGFIVYKDSCKTTILACLPTAVGEIVIPSSVTCIGREAFAYRHKITSIIIPDSVIRIENSAFNGCDGLSSINIPNSVIQLGEFTFHSCKNIRSVSIGCGVQTIKRGTFSGCQSLTTINIPNSVTNIEEEAFSYCTKLTSITIPNSVSNVDGTIFEECHNLDVPIFNSFLFIYMPPWFAGSYTIPNGIEKIASWAFYFCKELTSIVFPDSVTTIGEYAFSNCWNLSSISLGSKISYLGDFAFTSCFALNSIFIPASVTYIGDNVCTNCKPEVVNIIKDYAMKLQNKNAQEKYSNLIKQQEQELLQGSTLFFDTETTGVPKFYNAPVSNSNNWPRLVQLAWLMTDKEGKVIKQKSVIIKPEGFSIPQDAASVHGITTERAQREGLPLRDVLEEFTTDLSFAAQVVGHNIDFDRHIVGAELYRLDMDYNDIMIKPSICTMKSSTDFCAIPSPNSYYGGYKWPSLQELYRKLFNRDFVDAHDALADITATKECFFELKRRGII